ncbi:MAG: Ppx/GppA family phosphatase, partial [Sulfurimonadaceae bacterium]|nr:Ppx/GppA family phosphatase [Sulfurimonadaceae bacterium]
ISLDLGTVRLKELYFDTSNILGATAFIDAKLQVLDNLTPATLIGIGGSFRAIAQALILHTKYPLNKIHSFECTQEIFLDFIEKILDADEEKLKKLYIKSDRFDVIKPGALILQRVLKKFPLQNLITSGVGVREGVYLSDLLRNSKNKFPEHYNTSVRYLLDRHVLEQSHANELNKLAKDIFDLTAKHLDLPSEYRHELAIAAKLYPIGTAIHFYSKNKHSYYLIQSALEYGFTHKQIALIATLARYGKKKFPSQAHQDKYKMLLPETKILSALSYILSVSLTLLSHYPRNRDFDMVFEDNTLKINSKTKLYLANDALAKLPKFKPLKVTLN